MLHEFVPLCMHIDASHFLHFFSRSYVKLLDRIQFDYLLKIVRGSNVIRKDTALGGAFISASLCHHVFLIRRSYALQQLCTAVH